MEIGDLKNFKNYSDYQKLLSKESKKQRAEWEAKYKQKNAKNKEASQAKLENVTECPQGQGAEVI